MLQTIGIIAGLIFIVLALFVVVLLLMRRSNLKKATLRTGKHAKQTFLIRVPKFGSDGNASGEDSTAKIQEDISIAETFYAAIGGLPAQKGFGAWLSGRTDEVTLELAAHGKLIHFYLTVPTFMKEFVEQQLHAQYPDASIDPIGDYTIFAPDSVIVGGYLVLKRETVLPIKTYKQLENDPLNGITNAMSKVAEGEGVAIQYVLRSAPTKWRSIGDTIVSNMKKGMSYKDARKGSGSSGGSWLASGFKGSEDLAADNREEQTQRLSRNEESMLENLENKISKAGLELNVRMIAASKTVGGAQANLNQVLQAYAQFNIYEFGNAFTKSIPGNKTRLVQDFIYRRFNSKYAMVLNTEEMASLWHLPMKSTETPNINWMEARIAPVPTGLATEGLHLGYNEYRGVRSDVYMADEDRQRHMYVIGKTGSGKSYFLRYMALQDIRAGKGVCVIDPHGDLVDAIMGQIPKDRIDDVIYFNPSDMDRPMGLNMLEAPDENMRDFAVQEMISIFYMLFPPEMIGPMFEHNMRNFMLTLMADLMHPGTLVEIPRMISDAAFQKKWIAKVKDPVVRSFWEDEMAKTSDHHKSEMMGYLVSKVGRFVENEMMRNIIGQSKSAFDFRKIMDEGKILLINLSKGQTGEVNANLIGLIVVAKLQMAAFTRANIPEDERRNFYLYIDEFQNFITPSIATILSEARKYKLNLILAHQYMGQLVDQKGSTEIRDAILGNVGTTLVARVGPEDTDVLAKMYEPTFSAYDLMNTGKYTWNVKLISGNEQKKPFTLKAEQVDEPNPKLFKALKEYSRLQYGKPKALVEKGIALRAGIGAKKPRVAPPAPPSK